MGIDDSGRKKWRRRRRRRAGLARNEVHKKGDFVGGGGALGGWVAMIINQRKE